MKITAGMGSIDDYIPFVEAGADEVFCGYCPSSWQERYGNYVPLNRREVRYSNVQLGSFSELEILRLMMQDLKVPVTLTFNALSYPPDLLDEIAGIMKRCAALGFCSFIIADPALLLTLKEHHLTETLHLQISGEFGEMNRFLLPFFRELSSDRIIFHRKMSIADMKSMIVYSTGNPKTAPGTMYRKPEFEAFFLNERCHFHGGYCNSLHCDELVPMCREACRIAPLHASEPEKNADLSDPFSRNFPGLSGSPLKADPDSFPQGSTVYPGFDRRNPDAPGSSGCGFCSLWKLREIGITHLKIVGRGACSDCMLRDIRAAKEALRVLEHSETEETYLTHMRENLFPKGCSGSCYLYPVSLPDR